MLTTPLAPKGSKGVKFAPSAVGVFGCFNFLYPMKGINMSRSRKPAALRQSTTTTTTTAKKIPIGSKSRRVTARAHSPEYEETALDALQVGIVPAQKVNGRDLPPMLTIRKCKGLKGLYFGPAMADSMTAADIDEICSQWKQALSIYVEHCYKEGWLVEGEEEDDDHKPTAEFFL